MIHVSSTFNFKLILLVCFKTFGKIIMQIIQKNKGSQTENLGIPYLTYLILD